MDLHYGSPSSSHRGEWTNGSDGATRSNPSSPELRTYSQPHTTTPPFYGHVETPHSAGFPTPTTNKQITKEPADWDPRLQIPKPLSTFTARLNLIEDPTTPKPKMKLVNEVAKSFKPRYAARQNDDWTRHLDLLETEVFQKEEFQAKQIYFTIKITIFGEPERCMRRLEIGTERPNLQMYIPAWYKPKQRDWQAIALKWPFEQISYAMRSAILIVYFFHKFERGSSQKAL